MRHPEGDRYFLAIAIAMALKPYLLDRGICDDWNRVYLRHDLDKALQYARRAGFNGAPAKLPERAALLSPYYKAHAISEMSPGAIASVCWLEACETIRELIGAVAKTARRCGFSEEGAA